MKKLIVLMIGISFALSLHAKDHEELGYVQTNLVGVVKQTDKQWNGKLTHKTVYIIELSDGTGEVRRIPKELRTPDMIGKLVELDGVFIVRRRYGYWHTYGKFRDVIVVNIGGEE